MIVFLLRHAERLPDPADDLAPDGVKRAKLLAQMLAESGVHIAFCSDKIRTQRTIEPLRNLPGANVRRVDVAIDPNHIPDYVQKLVAKVKALPEDAIAIIVSHDAAIRPIVQGLTGRTVDDVTGTQFDKLFVLEVHQTGAGNVSLIRYGKATP
jgi:phosphohistidine phosphatase SixA